MKPYSPEIETQMQKFYQSLSEKDSRRYAAIEALKLGYGGISYLSKLLGCNYRTITFGMEELTDEEAMSLDSIRRSGGGRKSAFETIEGLDEVFLKVIAQHTAGSPMDEGVKWTYLTRHQIAELMQHNGIEVSVTVVDQLLEKYNFRKRKAVKTKATGESAHRNEQFENIERLVEKYQVAGYPVISMDTKKRVNRPTI
jgi:predicted ArsR family transcriptional regulator